MISAIQQSNCVIPFVKSTGSRSPASFADTTSFGQKEKKHKTSSFTKAILISLVLGAAAGIVAIGHRQLKLYKLKKEIQTHYDKAWKYVSKGFNQAKLQIEKPKIKYYSDPEAKSYGGYISGQNVVRLNLHEFESREFVVYKNEGQKIEFKPDNGFLLFNSKEIEQMKKDKLVDESWKIRNATKAERMFTMNAIIAHEQRHCVQYHFLLDNSEFGPECFLKNFADKLREKAPHWSEEEAIRLAVKHNPYWANYKPKGNTKDLGLVFPTLVNGQEVGFNAQELARNHAQYDKTNLDKYFSNALELDARAFEIEYLSRKDVQSGCAEDFVAETLESLKNENSKGINKFMNDNEHNISQNTDSFERIR